MDDASSQIGATIERLRDREPWVPWEAYLSATLRLRVADGWETLYSTKLGYRVDFFSARLGMPFGIITGWNPRGRDATERENRTNDHELHIALCESGGKIHRARGSSENGDYFEEGWACSGLSLRYHSVLAARFRQIAFYWCTASELWCVTADLTDWLLVSSLYNQGE
ncbi:MAG: DUF3293 domain-containing protein [Acidimicrobiales bacterium]